MSKAMEQITKEVMTGTEGVRTLIKLLVFTLDKRVADKMHADILAGGRAGLEVMVDADDVAVIALVAIDRNGKRTTLSSLVPSSVAGVNPFNPSHH